MKASAVDFFFEEIEPIPIDSSAIENWYKKVCSWEDHQLEHVSIIFCNDEYLLDINRSYLSHDYYTDIITFDISEESQVIEGELYISLDRVRENADTVSASFESELHRVLIHGVLHLMGYLDKSDSDQKIMRSKEDAYLSLLPQF